MKTFQFFILLCAIYIAPHLPPRFCIGVGIAANVAAAFFFVA